MRTSAWWVAHRVLLFALIFVTAAVAVYGLTISLRHKDDPASAPGVSVPVALARATDAPTPTGSPAPPGAPIPSELAAALRDAVAAPALGGRLLAHVVDAETGDVLYDSAGSTPAAPASTAKLLTAAAILTVHAPTDRFTTRVVQGAQPGTVVLVGGGDPTLTAAPHGEPGAYAGAARVADLASALVRAHVPVKRIVVDSSLFAGPSVSPDWDPYDVPTSYGAPITALMVDGARAHPTDAYRSGTPGTDAGHALAARLGKPDLPVVDGHAPVGAEPLASVRSAALDVLVDDMLQESDNVIAEVLCRQVALAEHVSPSFVGGAKAIRAVLQRLGVDVGGGMKDGSGLSAADRVSPAALTQVLRRMSGATGGSATAGMRNAFDALPVGGWSGTLDERYVSAPALSAAGRVRAKTGTLTGVSSLAGAVRDRTGRLLVFALDADRAPPGGSYYADRALDAVVAAVAACGCGSG